MEEKTGQNAWRRKGKNKEDGEECGRRRRRKDERKRNEGLRREASL